MFGRKGLFGRGMEMPETLPDMRYVPTTAGGMYGDPMPQQTPRKPSFFGQGGVGRAIAGTIGDVLLQRNGLDPMYGPQMQFQQQQSALLAAEQRKRAADLADYRTQLQIKAEFEQPDAPKPGSFEWFQTATPEQIAQFNSYSDIVNPVMTTTWQGPTVIPRRPPVGAKVSISDLGPEPQAPAPPAGPQAVAPATGARRISQADYQRILRGFNGDQRRMNAYMADQNILVGN